MSHHTSIGPWLIAFLGIAVLGFTLLLVAGCTTSVNTPAPAQQGATGATGAQGAPGTPGEKVIIKEKQPQPIDITIHH